MMTMLIALTSFPVPRSLINTAGRARAECYLDAPMVRSAMPEAAAAELDLVVIENVGNSGLPCRIRAAMPEISPVTEGEEVEVSGDVPVRTGHPEQD